MLVPKDEPLTGTDGTLIRAAGVNTARDEKTAEMNSEAALRRIEFILLHH